MTASFYGSVEVATHVFQCKSNLESNKSIHSRALQLYEAVQVKRNATQSNTVDNTKRYVCLKHAAHAHEGITTSNILPHKIVRC